MTSPLMVTAIQPSMGFPPNSVSDGENFTLENFSPKFEAPDCNKGEENLGVCTENLCLQSSFHGRGAGFLWDIQGV